MITACSVLNCEKEYFVKKTFILSIVSLFLIIVSSCFHLFVESGCSYFMF